LLSYESSAVNGVLFSLLSGIYWLKLNEVRNVKSHFVFFSVLLLIPFVILTISTLIHQQCPIDDGLWFYLLISVPSIPVGLAIAEFAKFTSRKLKYLTFSIFWLVVLLGFLPELYFNPQIYFYNPVFGYYPGVIYDQNIEITSELIDYRLLNIVISTVIIFIFSRTYYFKRITKLIVIIGVTSAYLHFHDVKPTLNFGTDLSRIKEELKSEISTKHFNIIIPDSLSDDEKELLKIEHEYYYQAISKLLDSEVDEKITSIIFESGAQKKRLFGSGNADVAKPWLNQIYLNFDNYNRSLKHEISHIFSAKYGSGPFKIPSSFNPGLIEGFAMAVENNYDEFDIDYLAAMALKKDFKISIAGLFKGFSFFASASSVSYIYAGSFFKYLTENYGWKKVKKLYSGEDFLTIFGRKLGEIEEEFYNYLSSLIIENNVHASNYYFGRLPLIKKFCVRATAKELRSAGKLYEEKEFQKSTEKFLEIYHYSGSYSALVGFSQAKRELKETNEAILMLESELENFEGTAYFYYLEFLLADFYALTNADEKAFNYYNKIINQKPHNRYVRSAVVKKDLLSLGDSILIKYMSDKDNKNNILTGMVETNPSDYSVQLFIILQHGTEQNYNERLGLIKKSLNYQDFSSNTFFEISKFCYRQLDFNESLIFAEWAEQKADFRRNHIIRDHIQKLKWILNMDSPN